MPEILIHRCRLRVVRRGGWSWGPDPRALSRAAVRALPTLLAAALRDLDPGEDDEREIAAPVRLRLQVRAGELMAALGGLPADGRPPAGSPAAALAQRLQAGLAQALAVELPSRMGDASEPEKPGPAAAPDGSTPAILPTASAPLGRLLLFWRSDGRLGLRLALLSEPALETWWAALLHEGKEHGSAAPLSAAAVERLRREATALAMGPRERAEGRTGALRACLTAAVEIAARCAIEPGHPAVMRALAEALPEWTGSDGETTVPPKRALELSCSLEQRTVAVQGAAPLARPAASVSPRPMPWHDAEIHVAHALPFLLLGPLSRTGYLETLAAVFAAAGLAGDLPLFAAALAYKTLPPPERGWRRTPAAMEAAAACAGLPDPIPEGDLSDLARRADPCLEPLAADLAASLLAGHEPGRPLLLAAAGEGLLLAEADGVFPIAWAEGLDGLQPALVRLRHETLLVSADVATPTLLREIDESGFRFVSAAPPTRGETWRPLRLPSGGRLWTNDDPAAPGLARQAAGLAAAEEGARRLWQALAVERPSTPLAAGPAFDRHLTLAAGVALGTLAWTLWRDREPVDPVLALERFADLDARVRFRARSVHVLLPLGRRHHDLFAHRLLEPVRDAVWLGGRALEFGGG